MKSDQDEVPMNVSKGVDKKLQLVTHHRIDPHRWLAHLYDHYHHEFVLRLGATKAQINAFWDGVHPLDPRLRHYDHIDKNRLRNFGIPILLHGDGVACSKKSLTCVQWAGIMGKGNTVDTHFLGFNYFSDSEAIDDDGNHLTKHFLWRKFCESLIICENGSHEDKMLAGGFFLVVWSKSGDEDWDINHLQMPGHWRTHWPCRSCKADRGTALGTGLMKFNLFSDDNTWMETTFMDRVEWLEWAVSRGKNPNIIFQSRAAGGLGLGPYFVFHDRMHVVDLRITSDVNGHVLWHFCYTDILDGSPQENMDQIWREIQIAYRKRKTSTQFGNLYIKMFTDPDLPSSDFPALKGKAAENRHLLPILRDIWKAKHRADNEYECHILAAMDALVEFYEHCDYQGIFLPESKVKALRKSIDVFLLHHAAVLDVAQRQHAQMLWPFVPKYHKLWHMGFESQFQAPKVSACYGGEDFVRIQKIIAESCRFGTPIHLRSKNQIQNYILGMNVKLTRTKY